MKTILVSLDGRLIEIPEIEINENYDEVQAQSRPRGRPATLGGRQRCVTLDDETVEHARIIGEGNISEGIRRAIQMIMQGKRP